MTSTASKPARSDRQTGHDEEARAARLRTANINPRTGLATDYLNHCNEAIILLEMIPDMPKCADFFFQAEDGIRDLTVTGVQTCASDLLILPVAFSIATTEGSFSTIPSPFT